MTNVIVVHGSNDSRKEAFDWWRENTRHWLPWLKKELEKDYNISCSINLYPCDWSPNYEEYKSVFEKNELNENTILIWHSAWCGFILKWLNENIGVKISKIILIAPYVFGISDAPFLKDITISSFCNKIKSTFCELIIFYSENDSDYIIDDAKKINSILWWKLLKFENKWHFILSHMWTDKFPELLEQIISE